MPCSWSCLEWLYPIVEQAHGSTIGPFQADVHGSPVAGNASDFFSEKVVGSAPDDFPYMQPSLLYYSMIGYVVGVPLLMFLCSDKVFNTNGKSALFKYACILHNFVLFAYSAWAAWTTTPLLLGSHWTRGYWATYCDVDGVMRNQIAAHVYLNYWSKVYEFLDTAVLIVKRKQPSWLQLYHHLGIVVVLYMCTVSRHPHGAYMVGYNAFVHTVMYAYFLLTELPIDRKLYSWVRPWITRLQIFQFMCGLFVATPALLGFFGMWSALGVWPSGQPPLEVCLNSAQQFATGFTQIYLSPLLALFINFYVSSYLARGKGRRASNEPSKTQKSD